jgi:hypothetical protein
MGWLELVLGIVAVVALVLLLTYSPTPSAAPACHTGAYGYTTSIVCG